MDKREEDRIRVGRRIEGTIIWLGLSLLFAIVGVQQILLHKPSGWFLLAMPAGVLLAYLVRAQLDKKR